MLNQSGADNRVHANRIHDVFDGIDLQEYPETLDESIDVQLDRGAEIWDATQGRRVLNRCQRSKTAA